MPFIQTFIIDTPTLGVRARLIEAFDTAMPTKKMIRFSAAELIAHKIGFALQKGEIFMPHEQMQIARSRAY